MTIIKRALALILALALCAGLLTGCSGGGYKKPIDTLAKALKTGKTDDFFDVTMPDFLIDGLVELSSSSKEKTIEGSKKSLDGYFENFTSMITRTGGKNWSLSYKITDEDRLDKEDLKDLAEVLDVYRSNSEPPKLQDGYDLEIDLIIKGKDDIATREIEATVIKYNGKWYIDQSIISELYIHLI
jgi:predicted small secreted protein